MSAAARDLLEFIDRSPTPFHAVAESRRRLEANGFRALDETSLWELAPGDARYVVRNGSSIVAFQVGEVSPAEGGFHVIGAHTDSPNLRVKPLPDVVAEGCRQVAVEPYGGVLLHTWLDRDLSLAGRVAFRRGDGLATALLDFGRPLLRVPSLAIHLHRELREEGLKLNPQQHALPVIGLEGAPPLRELLATELRAQGIDGVEATQITGMDLMVYDTQPSVLSGARGEFLHAPRLDNLASCHAAVSALVAARGAPRPAFTRMIVLYDHEEVGSRSAQGAAGTLLADALERVVAGVKEGAAQGLARAVARSLLISADMAHGVHPSWAERHEPGHRPRLGAGPVVKVNTGQSYASDGGTTGFFVGLCQRAGVSPQHFASRSDIACGSTIGPISASRVGMRTVDVGNPMLSMHSCREMAGTADVQPMIDVLRTFFETPLEGAQP
jgi:aspartyl aminopeptidase